MANIIPVILCGGSGTRLWPLSREYHPKQFVDLGNGRTLFEETLKRLAYLENACQPLCVCHEKYRFYVAPHLDPEFTILEPCARNTAPAAAMAALVAKQRNEDDLILILPADHYFDNPAAFAEAVIKATPLAQAGQIVTFGITPAEAATGFGYIKAGAPLGPGYHVDRFVEKPDAMHAQAMLEAGNHFWNAGIFLTRPSVYLEELGKFAPDILASCKNALSEIASEDGFIRPDAAAYDNCRSESIDYAVMEQTQAATVVPIDCGWNDMGSWESFYANSNKDDTKTAQSGRVLLDNVKGSYIHSSSRLVAAIGVENLAIVETQDAVLVAARDQVQKVKDMVARLKAEGASEYRLHRLVHKPWGSYEVLAEGDRFQVKRIIVNPGEAISLQMHHHRAEHWIIVSGTAEIRNGDKTAIFTENQSTYIPVGEIHRLSNPGLIPLCIIEIQSGPYLGEDDILRLEDPYKRKENHLGE